MAKINDDEVQDCVDALAPMTRKRWREMDEFAQHMHGFVVQHAQMKAAEFLPLVWKELLRIRKLKGK